MAQDDLPWDRPNGLYSHCSAPLNEWLVGGYRLHDGQFAVRHISRQLTIPQPATIWTAFAENEI